MRYRTFEQHLPLVLKTLKTGDEDLFKDHPELLEAFFLVLFISKRVKYEKVESHRILADY
jgi:hypothetical protein